MAETSFAFRVAEQIAEQIRSTAKAIVEANPIPPGQQRVSSFKDFLSQWRGMSMEQRNAFWPKMSREQRARMMKEVGMEQLMADLGSMTTPPEDSDVEF